MAGRDCQFLMCRDNKCDNREKKYEEMEVAEELAISQAQVSRLEKTAVKQLKKILK